MQKTKRLKQSIEQWTIGYGWCHNQEAKLKVVEGRLATLLEHVNLFKFTSSKVKTKFFNLLVFKCVQVGENVKVVS